MDDYEQNDTAHEESPQAAVGDQQRPPRMFIAAAILLVLASVAIIGSAIVSPTPNTTKEQKESEPIRLSKHIDIDARAAYVLDAQSGEVLYEKNAEAQLPLASVAKLMSVLSAARVLSGDQPITITSDAISIEGDSGFLVGDQFLTKDLIDYTLLTSSNDGAYALAHAAFKQNIDEELNRTAETLGLSQTFFINPTGLDASKAVSGAYGSARDVAHLMQAVLRHDAGLLEATRYPALDVVSIDGDVYHGTSTAEDIADIPGLLGLKTGFTDLAGGNLVVAFDAGFAHPMIAVVLGSSVDGRFADMRTLIEATRKAMNDRAAL